MMTWERQFQAVKESGLDNCIEQSNGGCSHLLRSSSLEVFREKDGNMLSECSWVLSRAPSHLQVMGEGLVLKECASASGGSWEPEVCSGKCMFPLAWERRELPRQRLRFIFIFYRKPREVKQTGQDHRAWTNNRGLEAWSFYSNAHVPSRYPLLCVSHPLQHLEYLEHLGPIQYFWN